MYTFPYGQVVEYVVIVIRDGVEVCKEIASGKHPRIYMLEHSSPA